MRSSTGLDWAREPTPDVKRVATKLLGLTATGAFLEPDLTSSLVIVKMACVLGISVVGVLTLATKRHMVRRKDC